MYLSYRVQAEDKGRTAEWVMRHRMDISSSLSRQMKRYRGLSVNGHFVLHMTPVEPGDLIEVSFVKEDELTGPLPNPLGLPVVYDDDWLSVVGKPPGLPSHPRFPGDPGLSTVFNNKTLHLINRLDMDTSGLVILGKNAHIHHLMARTPIRKIYLALVHGIVENSGQISAPIARKEGSIIERKIDTSGQEAVSHYEVLATWPRAHASLLAFLLETGRTHQIRVHAQYIGHPLVGDTLYGWEETFPSGPTPENFRALALNRLLKRQFLHAQRLCFKHPVSGEDLDLSLALPEDLSRVLRYLNQVDSVHQEGTVRPLLEIPVAARNIQ